MIPSKLKEIAKENNWNIGKNSIFGLYEDYYFQMDSGRRYKRIISYMPEIDYDTKAIIKNSILKKKGQLKISNVYVADNILAITFKEIFLPIKKEILTNGLEYITETLKINSIKPMNKCFQCGNLGDMKFYFNPANGNTKMICQSCAYKNEDVEFQKERTKLYEGRSYIKGIIGSLLFSLVGIIAWVAIAVYLNYITAFGAILIGLASFEGYKSFKGVIDKKAILVLLTITIFSIVIANYTSTAWEIHAYNSGIIFKDILYNLFYNSAIRNSIIKNIILSLLISIFPFIYIFQYLNKNMNLSKWVEASKAKT